MRFLFIVSLIMLCLSRGFLSAQIVTDEINWPYTYKHYSDEDGLPQNSVKAITVDQNGFLWLATESGVVRFDGQNFYTYDKSNTNLLHTRFYAIHPDLSGVKGRFYALAEFDEFVKIEKSTAEVDRNYFSTEFSSVPYLGRGNKRIFLATGSPNYWFDLSTPEHYVIVSPQRRGWFFVLSAKTISFYKDFRKIGGFNGETGLLRNYFTQAGGLYRHEDSGEVLEFTPHGINKLALEGDILQDPAYGRYSKDSRFFWNNPTDQSFILLGKNFYHLERNGKGSFRTRLILTGFDFDAKDIRTVYYDSKLRRVFLGSVTSGLHVFSKKQFRVLRVGNKDMDNIFYGQAVFDSNSVLTPTGAILGLSPGNDRRQSQLYRDKRDIFQQHLDQDGRSMFRGSSGNLWSKAFDYVFEYDPDGRNMLGKWYAGDQVKTIYEDVENDRVWLGLRKMGLYYLMNESKQIKKFNSKGFPEIAYLAKAEKNKLWVATLAGLYLANIDVPGAVLIRGTKEMNIRSLFPIKNDRDALFFTTYEDGVFFYKDGKLIPFPLDAKGHMASSHCIVEDKNGFFWISTNNGLFQVSKADFLDFAKKWRPKSGGGSTRKAIPALFYMYYSREDGFLTNEFNGGCQPCALQLPNGAVSMPSLNGLVWFWPDHFSPEVPSKPLIIDQVYLQGKRLVLNKGRVTLPVNPKQVEFHLSVPFFGNRSNIHLSYALVPKYATVSETDWITLSAVDPVIKFSDLSYGNYNLFVKKLNGFGIHNFSTASIEVIVPPIWYQSWWFKMIAVLLLAAGVYAYILFRIRFLQRRNSELEAKIARRTNRLQQTLAALQVSEKELNRQMHIQSRLIASISHDVRTPLRFIVASAQRIETFIRERQYEMIGRLSENIVVSGVQMAQFLENTMAYIKTQVYEKHIHMERILLLPLIQEKVDFFAASMKEQNTQLVNLVDPTLTVKSNAQLLGTIIHNVLDNAAKHTFEGMITIATAWKEKALHLIISDTGPGIPDPLIYWLNNGNLQDSTENMGAVDSGYNSLGLLIVREISGMINTVVHIENSNGARIHIIFQAEADDEQEGKYLADGRIGAKNEDKLSP